MEPQTITVPVKTQTSTILKSEEEDKQYRITKQFEDWCYYFTDKKNKDTYGNKTQSAIKAYNLDPDKQYSSAGVIGYENYKKLKGIASQFIEDKGFTLPKMLDIALAKMMKTDNKAWYDEVMILAGNKEPAGAQVLVQNNTQINNIDLNAVEAKDFNKKFQKFLEAES